MSLTRASLSSIPPPSTTVSPASSKKWLVLKTQTWTPSGGCESNGDRQERTRISRRIAQVYIYIYIHAKPCIYTRKALTGPRGSQSIIGGSSKSIENEPPDEGSESGKSLGERKTSKDLVGAMSTCPSQEIKVTSWQKTNRWMMCHPKP